VAGGGAGVAQHGRNSGRVVGHVGREVGSDESRRDGSGWSYHVSVCITEVRTTREPMRDER